jgi:SNF2 family DNA or RNA helicase
MKNKHFSINIIKDDLLGYLFTPYFLSNNNNVYYTRYKRINVNNTKEPLTDWMLKLVKLSTALTYADLNLKYNRSKLSFPDFLKNTDKSKKDFILKNIENKKIEILSIISKNKPLLFAIADRKSNIYPNDFIEIQDQKAAVIFKFTKFKQSFSYRLSVILKSKEIDLQNSNIKILTDNNPVILYNNKLVFFENKHFNANKLKPFFNKKQIDYEQRHESFLFEKFIKPALRKFECKIEGFELKILNIKPKAELIIEQTIKGQFVITPYFSYASHRIPFDANQNTFVNVVNKNGNYALESIKRNNEEENNYINQLISLGLKQQDHFFLTPFKSKTKYEFQEQINLILTDLQKKSFKIKNHLFKNEISNLVPKLDYSFTQKQDWFDLHIQIKFGEYIVEFKDLKEHILHHIREFILPNNQIAIIPKAWFSELYAFAKRTNTKNTTKLHHTHLQLLEKNKLLFPNTEIQKQISKISIKRKISLPKKINAQLRPYQKIGYQWMYHLTQHQFGVCLADDMGLGKTLQVISLLQKYFENKSQKINTTNQKSTINEGTQLSLFQTTNPVVEEIDETTKNTWISVLLILPKSLIYNWINEINKFAPELTYMVYHDTNRREQFQFNFNKKNLILTTYGVVRQDIVFLKNYQFSYLILDESQAIKNPESKIFQSVIQLDSLYKITMTGTPIENKLTDLWTQMSFLNENLLGNLSYFKKTYAEPIQLNPEALEITELKELINPFILRRLKRDVAKDLPNKIEQLVYCQMDDEQAEWYEEEKSAVRNELLLKKKEESFVAVLAALNRLRQIAIHPLLVDKESQMSSGKFDTILQYIHSILDQGDKFLIFSSFVKHLQLFKSYFEEQNIPYSMLTGKDNKREEIVERFQNTKEIKAFLISIKAGGVGLNLTAANYVFIIDPWWNPFVEQQAIDRTHRIGQDKNVMVYRFISKDSIEEKIQLLQKSKLKMSDSLLETGETRLNIKEILDLI